MGMYYARAAGLPDAVADAARDHWAPKGPEDAVPTEPVAVAVALADKIDTLTGFWAIDEKPTGSKDPFALRRAALGVIRLVLGNGERLSLWKMLLVAMSRHLGIQNTDPEKSVMENFRSGMEVRCIEELPTGSSEPSDELRAMFNAPADLLAFFHDRLKVFLKDQGIRHDVIDACLAMPGNDDLTLLVKRAQALQAFITSDDGTNLLQGFKRANNILSQAEAKDGVEYSFGADPKFAETDEERALFTALDAAEAVILPAVKAEDFAAAMAGMAALRAPIDAFFNAVQINADNQVLRRNRLNLLHRIRSVCAGVADLTRVEG
jgi:glycyl-tRNA synthetase beta chain